MKRFSLWAAFITIAAIAVATAYTEANKMTLNNRANNGAFRDGVYLGTLAAERGETPHVASGRWSAAADRGSFSDGYTLAYERTLTGQVGNDAATPKIDAAFRDGLYLGKLDAEQGRAAHVTSGRWARADDRVSFAVGYRRAFDEVSRANFSTNSEASLVK